MFAYRRKTPNLKPGVELTPSRQSSLRAPSWEGGLGSLTGSLTLSDWFSDTFSYLAKEDRRSLLSDEEEGIGTGQITPARPL